MIQLPVNSTQTIADLTYLALILDIVGLAKPELCPEIEDGVQWFQPGPSVGKKKEKECLYKDVFGPLSWTQHSPFLQSCDFIFEVVNPFVQTSVRVSFLGCCHLNSGEGTQALAFVVAGNCKEEEEYARRYACRSPRSKCRPSHGVANCSSRRLWGWLVVMAVWVGEFGRIDRIHTGIQARVRMYSYLHLHSKLV